MKVNNSTASLVARLYSRQATPVDQSGGLTIPRSAAVRPRTDSVSVSTILQEVARYQSVVAEQPDVRTNQVAALKAAVTAGRYSVDSQALAARLME